MNRSMFFGSAVLLCAALSGCGEENEVSSNGHSDDLEERVSDNSGKAEYFYNNLSSWENIPPVRNYEPTPKPLAQESPEASQTLNEEELEDEFYDDE